MRFGAIVLSGGRSLRMGRDKSRLPFGNETMLQRVLNRTRAGLLKVSPNPLVVVVAAEDRQPVDLPAWVHVAVDHKPDEGPLRGLEAGLTALSNLADAAFVTSCDVPFLEPAVIDRLLTRLNGSRGIIAAEEHTGRLHPLCAVYAVNLLPEVQKLLAAGERRLQSLALCSGVGRLDVRELLEVDASLNSLLNLNHPQDYEAALARISGLA